MSRTLLSAAVGVPIALLAMTLLFVLEMLRVSERPRPLGIRSAAVLSVVVLVVFIGARFMTYA